MAPRRTVLHSTARLPVRTLRVTVLEGPNAEACVDADSEAVTVGTAPGNHLELSDETVSRYHVELERTDRGVQVVDHGSTNGTWLHGARVERATVPPGTVLKLGRSRIRVDDGADVAADVLQADALGGLRGRSPVMRRMMAQIQRAAQAEASVLVLGETGTGKELIARALHECGPHAQAPFEVVDCGAQLPTLVASELFGHEKGAFTGADTSHVGAFERAHGGTLFMDELGELPNSLQPMLLGALERRSFRRVGGTEPVNVQVRFVAATHRDLRDQVNAGKFRQDLYFRVAVVLLKVPPLRERPEDVPLLVAHFLQSLGYDGDSRDVIPPAVMASLEAHSWPGNVRELRNFVEAAYAMGEAPHLEARPEDTSSSAESQQDLLKLPYSEARSEVLDAFERRYLSALMEHSEHNASEAARHAKMNRGYLNQLLRRHGLR